MRMENEIQHADVTIRVAHELDPNAPEAKRVEIIAHRVRAALKDGYEQEFRGVIDVELNSTESLDEAAERRMGEAEAAAEAKLERQAERAYEEGRWG